MKCPECERSRNNLREFREMVILCKKHGIIKEYTNSGGRLLIFPNKEIQVYDQCYYCDYQKLLKELKDETQ